jgi:hypothetical protein
MAGLLFSDHSDIFIDKILPEHGILSESSQLFKVFDDLPFIEFLKEVLDSQLFSNNHLVDN